MLRSYATGLRRSSRGAWALALAATLLTAHAGCALALQQLVPAAPAARAAIDAAQASVDRLTSNVTDVIVGLLGADPVPVADAGQGGNDESGGASSGGVTAGTSGDGYGGGGLVFEPASGNAKGTVVLLHGLSATVEQLSPLASIAQVAGLQDVRFILPQAPDAYVNYRNRVEPSWFNIDGTDASASEHPDEILAAADRVEAILQGEKDKGVDSVAVVGMSQGGAVASTVYMRGKVPLQAAALLATWLPLAGDYPDAAVSASKDTPALMIHGGGDKVVELRWAQDSAEVMRAAGRTIEFNVREGAPHVFGVQFIAVMNSVISYLKDRGF